LLMSSLVTRFAHIAVLPTQLTPRTIGLRLHNMGFRYLNA